MNERVVLLVKIENGNSHAAPFLLQRLGKGVLIQAIGFAQTALNKITIDSVTETFL